ncbi:MAG: hypothetical protein HC788_11430 [Sphingopyxis sp.]|nr:hypothetical protein [Sphingopyxis sp.]
MAFYGKVVDAIANSPVVGSGKLRLAFQTLAINKSTNARTVDLTGYPVDDLEEALEIGRLKSLLQMEIYQPAREEAVLRHVRDANPGPLDGDAVARLFERIIDEATIGVCAEACGAIRKLHDGTLEYSKQRKQFGQPIGKFQVLQHRMADMFIEVEQAASMTLMGTLKLDLPSSERMAAVSLAKAKVSRSAKFVGQNAIQTHGGIGITDELAIGHYFKRSTMIENQFGSADYHWSGMSG